MKILFILLFVAFCSVANAQTYFPLLDTGKVWSTKWEQAAPPFTKRTEIIKFTDDTIIDFKTYKKVLKSEDENTSVWQSYGYVREDSLHKVYWKYNQSENLIYDFSLQVLDTLKFENRDFIVKSIDSVLIVNEYRKRIVFDDYCETWIEGIGSLSGILNIGQCGMTGGWTELLCFHENGELLYINPTQTVCYLNTVGTIEIEKPDIEIFYADKFLNINFTEKDEYELIIYDILGNSIFSKQIQNSDKINLENYNLKQGIYLYSISKKNEIIKKDKIVYLK